MLICNILWYGKQKFVELTRTKKMRFVCFNLNWDWRGACEPPCYVLQRVICPLTLDVHWACEKFPDSQNVCWIWISGFAVCFWAYSTSAATRRWLCMDQFQNRYMHLCSYFNRSIQQQPWLFCVLDLQCVPTIERLRCSPLSLPISNWM